MLNFFLGDKSIIPVVMFHSVGLQNATDWPYHYISEPIENFEEKIKCLWKAGYNFIFWQDLFLYMSGRKKIALPAVMLTFDDGYLDNWLYVFPLLKKYEARATIFVNPEFVSPVSDVRTISKAEIYNAQGGQRFTERGFLNWEEMRIMEQSGLVDIQSHSMTHTWYFSGPNLIAFHAPEDNRFPWLQWNMYPDSKPYYMDIHQKKNVPYGLPVYEHEKALVCHKYFPPKEVESLMTRFVEDNGGKKFFQEKNWENILSEKHKIYFNKYRSFEKFEDQETYEVRIFKELEQSKQIIEYELEKKVNYICWPGGAYNSRVTEIAKDVGYKAWTLGSKDQSCFRNNYCVNYENVKRIGSYIKVRIKDKTLDFASGKDFMNSIKRHQNSFLYKYYDYLTKTIKLLRL